MRNQGPESPGRGVQVRYMKTIKKVEYMKKITTGILAHVDAGKTTLSEALLYLTGTIRKLGRVDHRDAFFDTDSQERERGITIFSKQAQMEYSDTRITLLDTPGHVDFSAEMERTLQVINQAILVISGKDGVQGHTLTLWRLFEKYGIPVFIFINKMDLQGADRKSVMDELKQRLDDRCTDFSGNAPDSEEVASCHEQLLEEYFDTGELSEDSIRTAISDRQIFPCWFGSALKNDGVETFLEGFCRYAVQPHYGNSFGARVFKITRDSQGNRLTHLKLTGGNLKVKEPVSYETSGMAAGGSGRETKEEKIEQIRIYSGEKFRNAESVSAGDVCAVTGLTGTFAGQVLGAEKQVKTAFLEPALVYDVILPDGQDVHGVLAMFRQLEEEEPQLNVVWNEQLRLIQLQLMGEIQLEILKNIMAQRFGVSVGFGQGRISYRETIKSPVIGSGHFEPLRHYAEVHLLLEPAEQGSGMTFATDCSEDQLDRNWQRLILTHLMEKQYTGVLTNSPVTDMKITVIAGRAHLKHTEGGDFRQATYRAVRQGLRKAETILLEPWYEFTLEIPQEMTGRAMSDIQRMGGSVSAPVSDGSLSVLTGKAPVSEMKNYSVEVASYTKGCGHLICDVCGYEPCHDQQQVVESTGYDPDRDTENTADSVFCSGGAGHNVKWDEADSMMHVQPQLASQHDEDEANEFSYTRSSTASADSSSWGEEDLKRYMDKAYIAPKSQSKAIPRRVIESSSYQGKTRDMKVREEYLIVDGYNIIFAWDDLKALSQVNFDASREALIEILENYQGYRKCRVMVVFDAYKVKGGTGHTEKIGEVEVVYTKEGETADTYIERMSHDMKNKYTVRVASSDNLEQMIATGNDALRMSAGELRAEVELVNREISELLEEYSRKNRLISGSRIKI